MRRTLVALALLCLAGCADPDADRLRETTVPTYDKTTGRLVEVTFDANKNGVIDTWTTMDGTRPVLTRIDQNEDGKVDRWEYHGADGALVKVGFSRQDTGVPDAWALEGADGRIERIEISSVADETRIDRREFHDAGGLARAEDDTDGDGVGGGVGADRVATGRNRGVAPAAGAVSGVHGSRPAIGRGQV